MIYLVVPICLALVTATAFAAICRYALARSWLVALMSGFGLFAAVVLTLLLVVTPLPK
jgi:hypothetical protein